MKSGLIFLLSYFIALVFSGRCTAQSKEKKVPVIIGLPVYEMEDDRIIGSINGKKKTLADKDIRQQLGFEAVLEVYIEQQLEDTTKFEAIRENMIRDDSYALFIPKVILQPYIRNISFKMVGKNPATFKGECSMDGEWKIFKLSDKKKIIGKIPFSVSLGRAQGNNDYILAPLIREATKKLTEIDTLPGFLFRAEHEYLNDTRGEPVKIKISENEKSTQFRDALKKAVNAVVTVKYKDGHGSGFIISPNGYIVTNYHVIKRDDKREDKGDVKITVITGSEETYTAEVIKLNRDFDLALIKIKAYGLKTLSFGASDSVEAGDEVYAIGTPVYSELNQSVTKGIISGIRYWYGVELIQTDVAINPGNSGGALINMDGEVIGVTSFTASRQRTQGLGFCIPSNTVLEMLNLRLEK